MSKLRNNKKGEKFGFGLFVVVLAISISLFAFLTEENKITGYAAAENSQEKTQATDLNLIEFKDINSLSTLAAGNYYIDNEGIVYWIDDESRPAIAKVTFVDEIQKNRDMYIDDGGRIGYVLSSVSANQK